MPSDKYDPTSVNGVVCKSDQCIEYNGISGQWLQSKYQKLPSKHNYHVSWNIEPSESFMLLGK